MTTCNLKSNLGAFNSFRNFEESKIVIIYQYNLIAHHISHSLQSHVQLGIRLLTKALVQFVVEPETDKVCSDEPCMNGGSCVPFETLEDGYYCICTKDYKGFNCQIPSDGT